MKYQHNFKEVPFAIGSKGIIQAIFQLERSMICLENQSENHNHLIKSSNDTIAD